MSVHVPDVTLNNGVPMPQLGLGVFQVGDAEAGAAVTSALQCGYRSVDTAALYGNEQGVGAALRAAGIARADLFVTTKLWNADQGYDSAFTAYDRSLGKLGLDHVDLYLIHWPVPSKDAYVDTWRALIELLAQDRVRAIGVSNFQQPHLERLIEQTGVTPAVNQIELHPSFQQAALRKFHARHGIVTEAWSPLGQGAALNDPLITRLAAEHRVSPAQIVLRWHLELGNVVIPKSVTPARIRQNIDVFGFSLTRAELAEIAELDTDVRIGPDPAKVGEQPSGFSTRIDPALS